MKVLIESIYNDSLNKVKNNLIKDMGLSEVEANYVTLFYDAIKKANLLSSNYFKEFEYEGELFDLNDIQKLAKYPEAFYDVVMLVFHNAEFLKRYNIIFNGVDLKLIKKEEEIKKSKDDKKEKNETPFDNYKVAEDDFYYTFFVPNSTVAQKFRSFYSIVYPNDSDIHRFQNFFFPTWCVFSSSAKHHFKKEKHLDSDIWLVTFLKRNPVDYILKMYNKQFTAPVNSFQEVIDKIGGGVFDTLKDYLGEVYLMNKDGGLGSGRNYGYHLYTNSPGYGVSESKLFPNVSYSYGRLNIAKAGTEMAEEFEIEDGVLKKVSVNKQIVRIPLGVTEIDSRAFSELNDIKTVITPISLIRIKEEAFYKMKKLEVVMLHNSLEIIETDAIKDCPLYKFDDASSFIIGVLEKYEESQFKYSVSKPSQLRFAPREIILAYRKKQNNVTKTENNTVNETFRIKRNNNYKLEDAYSLQGQTLIFDGDLEEVKDINKLVVPEGITKVKGSLSNYTNLEEIVFPKNLQDIGQLNFKSENLIKIDLSKSVIAFLPEKIFSNIVSIEEVILPNTQVDIYPYAFASTSIEEIYIIAGSGIHEKAFYNCPFLEIIYTNDLNSFMTQRQNDNFIKWAEKNKIKIKEK